MMMLCLPDGLRLKYPEVREGVKKFSDWPTIPQLYVSFPQRHPSVQLHSGIMPDVLRVYDSSDVAQRMHMMSGRGE